MRRLYNWTMALASGRRAPFTLAVVSFSESSFFPIPPDVLLLPMSLARPDRALFYAGICTVTSVLGGLAGYAIGALLYDTLGLWIIQLYGHGDGVQAFRAAYAQYGAWIILLKGLTPIPYKLVTITSGFAGYDLVAFVALSLITRGIRFYALAGLLNRFGEPIRWFIEQHFSAFVLALAAIVIGGFLAVKLVF